MSWGLCINGENFYMCRKKQKTDNVPMSNYVVSGEHNGQLVELPSNVEKIRLETDNKNLFYRAYGAFKNPDTKLILSAPG